MDTRRALSAAVWAWLLLAAGCDLAANSGERAESISDVTFERSDGTCAALSSYADATARLLVLRHVTAWCGPCQWHADHTRELIPDALRERVRVIDVVMADENNAAAGPAALEAWSARTEGAADSVADPEFSLAAESPERSALPLIAVVDARDLRVAQRLSAPDPESFANALHSALARLDRESEPAPVVPELYDERFTRDQWQMIQAMRLPSAGSDDPSNAYSSNPAAAALGKRLFFDTGLTPSAREVACSSCHWPESRFQDGRDRPAQGMGVGVRNVPTILLAADKRWQLWDGRADSAWAQATIPFEDVNEMASSRLFIAHAVAAKYSAEYTQLFGALPPLAEAERFPALGGPGSDAWNGMAEADRMLVSRVLANVGKAIAAYERSLRPEPCALDRYADGDTSALSALEKDGLRAFFDAGCAQCHHGPRLTDDSFHNLRFPTGRPDRSPDLGRNAGLEILARSEFQRTGSFSDDPSAQPLAARSHARLEGAFKTPGLRGVAFTLPYGHGGSFGGLASTLDAHRAGLPSDSPYSLGETDFALLSFDRRLTASLIAFLNSLRLDLPE